jgi:hypothetical protein
MFRHLCKCTNPVLMGMFSFADPNEITASAIKMIETYY